MITQTKLANSMTLSSTNQVQHLVFIDSNVSDYSYLAAGVIPNAEVIILEPNQDGIKQITKALNSYSYSYPVSLHIISHGSPGCLYLGNTNLSLNTLDKYKQDLKSWFPPSPHTSLSSPSPHTFPTPYSLLIYGCNVAVGDAGEEFIAKLHNLTGVKIAASTTPVGNTAKGGKWELDYQTKFIATPLIFKEEIKSNYTEVFADEKFSLGNRVWQDDNNNGQIDGSESGIDGVVVNLYEDSDNNGSPNGGIIATTTTADGGYYRFDNLNASNYIVEVAASNFNTGNVLNGLVSSSTDEAEPDNDIDANDNGIGVIPNVTNGIRSNTVTLGAGFSEPTGEDFVPPPTTSTSIDLGQTETTGGNGTNVRMNAVDSSNAGSTTGRITLEFEPERFIIDVAGFGNDLTGFCLEFAELANPNLNYTAVNATTTGPFFNSSYNDPDDIPNFYGPGDNPDPNSIPADYGIITQAELDIISTVWANVENTILTNANDAAALQLLIWELQNDQTFDLTNGNFILDATGSTSSTVNANTSAAITTVNSWYTNATNGTWTGSVPLALLTVEDQQDIIVSFDLGVGSTDTQSNLTVDFAFNDLIDYGDAPDTQSGSVAAPDSSTLPDYQTTQTDGGASHAIDSNLYMGSGIDPDDGTQQNSNADADDTVNSGLADDEDGISFTTTDILTSDDTFQVSVTATNNTTSDATVVGWIDFDRSGTFDADEAVSTTILASNTTTKPLVWDDLGTPIPNDITLGETYARFRISTDAISTSTGSVGQLSNGEVEDYKLNIKEADYGDAPDGDGNIGTGNYDTTKDTDIGTTDTGGAAHIVTSGLSIGSTVDADNGTLENTTATADDNDTDDEDGVEITSTLKTGDTTYSINVDVTNTLAGSPNATLVGWIDFDQDGLFESTEAATVTGINASGQQILTWSTGSGNLPSDLSTASGITYARFRLSTDTDLDATLSTGLVDDGEVEDYQIGINVDYGDAPDGDGTIGTGNYDTTVDTDDSTADTGGAGHIIDSNLKLGTNLDADSGILNDNTANADDNEGTDDEDGISFTSVLDTDDSTYSVTVDVTNNNPTEDATLIGWIDFDRDGIFESSEAVSKTISANSGQQTTTLDWSGLSGLTAGDTYARFRISTDSAFDTIDDSTSVGLVSDGEVEDYQINIKNTVTGTGGSDSLTGSTGDDIFIGGAGQDTLVGDSGDDCFHFNQTSDGIDIIQNFSSGDKIDLSDFFATGGELAGITNPFDTYVEALPIGTSGTLIQIDFDNSNDPLLKKNLVYLDGYDTSTTAMTADDFIF